MSCRNLISTLVLLVVVNGCSTLLPTSDGGPLGDAYLLNGQCLYGDSTGTRCVANAVPEMCPENSMPSGTVRSVLDCMSAGTWQARCEVRNSATGAIVLAIYYQGSPAFLRNEQSACAPLGGTWVQ